MLQWLWLSCPGERLSDCFCDQLVDSLQKLSVVLLPIQVVFPSFIREDQLHLASLKFGQSATQRLHVTA
jgi:hypothetical protein